MQEIINTSIDRQLALEFFLVLSRVEFALKTSGYARGDDQGVNPDWDRFAYDLRKIFNPQANEELKIACEYYLMFPPQKQILETGVLSWCHSLPNTASKIETILLLIRRVRNNLFHGGKYNIQAADETERNEFLLKAALCILKETMRLIPDVRRSYEMAAI